MKKPIITIIIPCYNSAEFIKNAILSIYAQEYENWELIIVNDGSTDDTLSIINEFSIKDSRIRVYSKNNGGAPSAVNYALDKINGQYFTVMGSDDELLPSLFKKCSTYLESMKYDCIYFKTIINSSNVMVPDSTSNFDKILTFTNSSILDVEKEIPYSYELPFLRDTSRFFKTKCLKDIRYFGKIGVDADGVFSMLINHNCRSFCFLPIEGYKYNIRGDSVSNSSKNVEDRIIVWTAYFNYIVNKSINGVTNHEIQYYQICINLIKVYTKKYFIKPKNILIQKRALKAIKKFLKHTNIYRNITLRKKMFLNFSTCSHFILYFFKSI